MIQIYSHLSAHKELPYNLVVRVYKDEQIIIDNQDVMNL